MVFRQETEFKGTMVQAEDVVAGTVKQVADDFCVLVLNEGYVIGVLRLADSTLVMDNYTETPHIQVKQAEFFTSFLANPVNALDTYFALVQHKDDLVVVLSDLEDANHLTEQEQNYVKNHAHVQWYFGTQ